MSSRRSLSLLKFLCHVLKQPAYRQVLRADLLTLAALEAVGRPAPRRGVDGVVVIIRVPVVVEALGVHCREQVGDGDMPRAAVRAVAAGRAGDEVLAAALAAEPYALILPQSTSKIQRDFLLCFAWAQTNSEK